MASIVEQTESSVRGSIRSAELKMRSTSELSSVLRNAKKSRCSMVATTSKMEPPRWRVATMTAASTLTASEFQKSDSLEERSLLVMTKSRANARACRRVDTPSRGSHVNPSSLEGSRTTTRPWLERHRPVTSKTSRFTEVTTTGPLQRRRAGTTMPLVLPTWVGPTTRRDERDGSSSSGPTLIHRLHTRPSGGPSLRR